MVPDPVARDCSGGVHGRRMAIKSFGFVAFLSALIFAAILPVRATWETEVDGTSFNSTNAFTSKWSYNYPWGTNHNGSAVMNATNVIISNGVVIITSSLTNHYEGVSAASPYLTIRYNSGTFYLNQHVTVNSQYPLWDISGQFKVPTVTGTW